ncbi:MAG: DMT family transporter [Prevotella sp.]|nr:DMT family transporter [Prevotella sp.]
MLLCHFVALMVVTIWGSTFVFTKLLLLEGFSAAQIFTLRFLIAYVLLLAFQMLTKSFRMLADSWRDELIMLGLGVTGGSVYFLAENTALNYTTTTNTSLIVCSCPLVAALMIGLFYKSERMSRTQLVGALMAVMGVAVVVMNGRFVLHLSPVGDVLALSANFCWAVYSLLMIPVGRRYDSLLITRKVFFYGLLTMIPYYLSKPDEAALFFTPHTFAFSFSFSPSIVLNLLYLGCIASMFCFLAWTWVMKRLGAVVATNYVYINPLTTIVFAWWLLSEPITVWFLLGALLIIAGMYLADKNERKCKQADGNNWKAI